MTLDEGLQALVNKEAAKARTHDVLLRVTSGDGRVDFRGAGGSATPDARFPIASIAKMFTAALIKQLSDEGRIDLDQTAQSLLPDLDLTGAHVVEGVDHGPRLTVRQLLHQTSGLADYYEGGIATDLKAGRDRAFDLDEVLTMARALSPQAAPGSGKSYYSDTNYQLLGAVIETVTGQTFNAALQGRICAPLGLTKTRVAQRHDIWLPVRLGQRPLLVPQMLASMGPDGGIVSTPDELMIFLRSFMQGRLFDPANLGQMMDWNRLFFPISYGYGLMRIRLPRWMTLFRATPDLVGHSGSSGSFAFHAPAPDIYLTGTFNQIDAPKRPVGFMLKVLDLVAKYRV